MNKDNLLKLIAESGYNLGYGAKKHFATFDLVEKLPGWLGFLAFAIGIFALFTPPLASNEMSAVLLIFGIATFYINSYNAEKAQYEESGKCLTDSYNKLRSLYYEVKSLADDSNFSEYVARHEKLYEEAFMHTLSKQIFLSDWYAHYKFFWQQQTEWIDEQKNFTFLRDKIPLSFSVAFVIGLLIGLFIIANHFLSICS